MTFVFLLDVLLLISCGLATTPPNYRTIEVDAENARVSVPMYPTPANSTTTVVTATSCQEGAGSASNCAPVVTTEVEAPYRPWAVPCPRCEVVVSRVQLLYFPPLPTLSGGAGIRSGPPQSFESIAVSDGFTFTSPSVYAIYESVSAYPSCEHQQTVGHIHSAITVAYNPDAVSINYCDVDHDGTGTELAWRPLNVTELAHPYPNSELASRFGCSNIPSFAPSHYKYTIMQNAIYSLPLDLTTADPAWKSCDVDVMASDPPRSLTRVAAMGPPTTLPASPSLVRPAARISLQSTPTSRPAVDPVLANDPPHQSQAVDPKSKPSASSTSPAAVPNSAPTTPGGSPDPGSKNPHANAAASVADPLDPLRLVPSKHSGDPGLRPAETGPALNPTKPKTGDGNPDPDTDSKNQPLAHPSNSVQGPGDHQSSDSPSQPSPKLEGGGSDQISNHPDPNTDPKAADPSHPASPGSVPSKQPQIQKTQVTQSNSELQPTTPIVIGKQTFSAGPTPVVFAGATHSIAAPGGDIIVNGHTISQASQPQPSPELPSQVLSIGTQRVPYSVNSASKIIIDSHTLRTNSHIVIASQTVALNPSATDNQVLVDGESVSLPALGTPKPTAGLSAKIPPLTVAGQTLTHNSAGGLMIGSHTLVPGGPAITISGSSISIAPASQITVDGSTIALSPAAPTAIPNVVVGGHRITQNKAGDLVIASSTLKPGGGAIIISNTPIGLAPSANELVIGSSTIPLSKTTQAPAITFKGQTITANSASQYVIAGQTLTPGGGVTVSGTPLSLDPAASRVVIGSSTIVLSGPVTSKENLRVGGQTLPYSINAASAVVVAGSRTLTPGGAAITVSGTLVSAIRGSGSAKPEVVVGEGSGQTTEALGSVIMSGFGPAVPTGTAGVGNGGGSNGTTGPESFTGVATTNKHGICGLFSLFVLHLYIHLCN